MNYKDNIAYHGEVNFTKKFGKKVDKRSVKNEGLVDLFALVTKALAGINTSSISPAYLAIYNGNDDNASLVAGPFPLIGTTHSWTDSVNHQGQVGVVFQGSVRSDENAIVDTDYLVLVSKANQKLAQVQFGENLSSNVDEVLVEWVLWFGNAQNA